MPYLRAISPTCCFMRFLLLLVLLLAGPALADDLQMADLGRCELERGAVLDDCRLGYRTFGTLNADRSNAILFPTWFTGTSAQLIGNANPGQMADSTLFFVIFVDAFANGVSSSPSNSPGQADAAFPEITIGDMVRAQHRLVTEVLGLDRLHAVLGISMGGMQTFAWMSLYPEMLDKAVPIIGSPKLTPHDRLLWTAQLRTLQSGGFSDDALRATALIHMMMLETPAYMAARTDSAYAERLREIEASARAFGAHNWAAQLEAMLAQDVYAAYGSRERTAEVIREAGVAVLVVVAAEDQMVHPAAALAFAEALDAPVLTLPGACGHLATGCHGETMHRAVRAFLTP